MASQNIFQNGLNFELCKNGMTAEITKSKNANGDIIIPCKINYENQDYTITSIKNSSFAFNNQIKSIIFQNDSEITTIGESAFSYSSLERITIPSKVSKIGINAFFCCIKLDSVTFEENSQIQIISKSLFSNSSLKSITIPRNVETIEEESFDYCNKLKKIEFQSNSKLKKIEKNAFFSSSFESLFIPPEVEDLQHGWCNHIRNDVRDYEFAQKYGLAVKTVIQSDQNIPFCGDGPLINSGEFDNLSGERARDNIIDKLVGCKAGEKAVNYKLRDWLFSRQRYWGEPIPIIWIERQDYEYITQRDDFYFREFLPDEPVTYGNEKGVFCALPLTSRELPLILPEIESYLPSENGESPLAGVPEWVNVYIEATTGKIIPAADFKAGTPGLWIRGRRETNTMPQWAGSCWYYLRYMSPRHSSALVEEFCEKYWRGPDLYVGGVEHAVLHLLYARFWHRFLYDIGVVSTNEPFERLFHQGIILGEDGAKMSKSLGNVINPDDIVNQYGADSFRLYEMFLGPLDAMKPWNSRGIDGVYRFLTKLWRMCIDENGAARTFEEECSIEERKIVNDTVQKVTQDIEIFHFNTAISQMMICLNFLLKSEKISKYSIKTLLQLLSPFAPHITEELYHQLGGTEKTIADVPWPQPENLNILPSEVTIVVQFNGKVRGEVRVSRGTSEDELSDIVKTHDKLSKYLENKEVVKKVYIQNKVINFVLK